MITHTPPLKDLFRLALPERVTWLAGEAAAELPIHWVALSLSEAAGGDLLLLPAQAADPQVFAEAREKDLAAVLLIGEKAPPDPPLLPALPVAWLAKEYDAREAQRLLLTILLNQRTALHERGARLHAQLSQLEAEGRGLDGLAKAMADISGEGIIVQDKRGQILAECASSALLTIWDDVIQQLDSLNSLPEALQDRRRAGSQPAILEQEIPGGLARVVIPIVVGEVARGYLSLVGVAGELDALDQLVAEQGALVCAVEMARAKAVREAEKRLKGDLLTVLLQENLTPRDARLWAQAVELDLSKAHIALRFAWDGSAPPSRRRLETIVNGEVKRLGLKAIVSAMGTEVVCFCEVPLNPSRPERALEFAQGVLDQGQREYPHDPIRCGASNPAQELSSWRDAFRQAGQALEMARRFDETRPLFFPDLSVYRLLFQFEHNPELLAFQEEILGPLLAYEGGRDLIQTLEAYFEHNGNLTQAAEALFVHRNTLIYRLERIAGIAGLDLDEPETRLAVQLALHIYRMRGGLRGAGD